MYVAPKIELMSEVVEEESCEDKISSISHISDSEEDRTEIKSVISLDEVDDRNPSENI